MNDVREEGLWEWTENETKLTFTNWAADYPNNNMESCTYLSGPDVSWDQEICLEALPSICKKQINKSNRPHLPALYSTIRDQLPSTNQHFDKPYRTSLDTLLAASHVYTWYLIDDEAPRSLDYALSGNLNLRIRYIEMNQNTNGYVTISLPVSFGSLASTLGFKIKYAVHNATIENDLEILSLSFEDTRLSLFFTSEKSSYFLSCEEQSLCLLWQASVEANCQSSYIITWIGQKDITIYQDGVELHSKIVKKSFFGKQSEAFTLKIGATYQALSSKTGSIFIVFSDINYYTYDVEPPLTNYAAKYDSLAIPTNALYFANLTGDDDDRFLYGPVTETETGWVLEKPYSSLHLLLPQTYDSWLSFGEGFSISFKLKFLHVENGETVKTVSEFFTLLTSTSLLNNSLFTGTVIQGKLVVNFSLIFNDKVLEWQVFEHDEFMEEVWKQYVICWDMNRGLTLYTHGRLVARNVYPTFDVFPSFDKLSSFLVIGAPKLTIEDSDSFVPFKICCVSLFSNSLSNKGPENIFGPPFQGIECLLSSRITIVDKFASFKLDHFSNEPVTCRGFIRPFAITSFLFRVTCEQFCTFNVTNKTVYSDGNETVEIFLNATKDQDLETSLEIISPSFFRVETYEEKNGAELLKVTDELILFHKKPVDSCEGVKNLIWKDVYGYGLQSFTIFPSYPRDPSLILVTKSFTMCHGLLSNYGAIMFAYFLPPDTANFSFKLSSQGSAEFLIHRNEDIIYKTMIAATIADEAQVHSIDSPYIFFKKNEKIFLKLIYKAANKNYVELKIFKHMINGLTKPEDGLLKWC